jgi:RNA polymerase sigma factor (sigma-70 family)
VLVRCLDELREDDTVNDRELLRRYSAEGNEDAFAALVRRYGSLVWGVCKRGLPQPDAEDVYQATFLVLARKADSTAWREWVGGWLHAVATRLTRKVRSRCRRLEPLQEAAPEVGTGGDPLDSLTARELLVALDEELAALPVKYSCPVLLCLVEGKTQNEAAALLGVSLSAVRRRLQAGRERLALRLRRRGLSLSVLALPALSEGVPPTFLSAVEQPARVIALAEALAQTTSTGLRVAVAALVLLGVVGLGLGLAAPRPWPEDPPSREVTQPGPMPPAAVDPQPGRDRHGDLLPAEALTRLGTIRLRAGGKPTAVAFTPGGKMLLSVTPHDGLRLWEVPSGKDLGHLPPRANPFEAAAFSADGKRLALTAGNEVCIYEVRENPPSLGDEVLRFKPALEAPLRSVAFRRDGSLVIGADDARVALHDGSGTLIRVFGNRVTPNPGAQKPHVFCLSPDEKTLVVADEKTVSLWNLERGTQVGGVPGLLKVSSLAFSPDGKLLALGDENNTIRVWDVGASNVVAKLIGAKAPDQLRGVGDAIRALVFTPDSKQLISLGDYGDGTVRIWDVATGKQSKSLQGRYGDGNLLALAPDGKTLAVAGNNGTLRLWDPTTGKETDTLLGTQGVMMAVAVDPAGTEVVTAGSDGMIYVWDRAGKPLRQWRAHNRFIGNLAYGPDSGKLYSVGAYEPARVWDTATGKQLIEYAGSTKTVLGVASLAVAPDGKQVVLAAYNQQLQLVDTATGRIEKLLAQGSMDRGAFSPDGKWLVGGGFDKMVHLWEIATGKEKWNVPLASSLASAAYAPDGKTVVAGTYDGHVLVLDSATGLLSYELLGRSGVVRTVAFSRDGRLLAAAGDSSDVTLYEVASRQVVRKLEGHRGKVWSLTFTPDSQALVTASFDGTALVWDVSGQLAAKARKKPPTEAEVDKLWGLLGNAESTEGYDAVLVLASVPDLSAALFQKQLSPTGDTPKMVARWLNELDDDEFPARERASEALARLGKSIEPELRKAREQAKSVEASSRLDALLARLVGGVNESVRGRRALAVLELANTPRTRQVLELLARDGITEEIRVLSRQALERMPRRP